MQSKSKPPPSLPERWPDGKHRSWKTLPQSEKRTILLMLRNHQPTEVILQKFPHVSVGTLAAVRASLSRRTFFGKR